MLPRNRVQSSAQRKITLVDRVQRAIDRIPFPQRIVPIAGAVVFLCPVLAPVALITRAASKMASAYVAMLAIWIIFVLDFDSTSRSVPSAAVRWTIFALPVAIAIIAHLKPLNRRFVPCRTVVAVLLWPVILIVALLDNLPTWIPVPIFVITVWVVAIVALGWRLAKGAQAAPRLAGQPSPGGPGGVSPGHAGQAGPGGPVGPLGGQPPMVLTGAHAYGARAQGVPQGYADRMPRPQPPALPRPQITIEEAMADLDAMVGLAGVKEQVRSIAASIEAARRRAVAGVSTDKPMRHFVFLGPPGTGKTTVARVIGKIFYAFGLLDLPDVVEAQRSDLVGEYLGATAIKTNELIDSSLGRVLFIDEAYGLVNEGDGQADRFGTEAVQTLLKRAEDDRENLILILAGYEQQMEAFLASNPGLASRFATRIRFPTYSSTELLALADTQLAGKGEVLAPAARPVLWRILEEVGRRRITDELGNGRFVRNFLEKAGQARDVRVMGTGYEPAAEDLITIDPGDLDRAFNELTSRLRGYEDTPTLDSALAELNELVGLEPVKQQVHSIAAQLRVAKLRDRQGLSSQQPARHFVFTGPPGTGKTTVARILGRIFAALGLLVRPEVIEAHRGDLVGDHLGSTAIKTNKLVDSAIGGVLFIDEAYSLINSGYTGGDAFGAEAVQTLLKRAEDDRDRLVVVLAGYTGDMDRFLRSNPGLGSRFSTRVTFPSYSARDLSQIAVLLAEQAGDMFEPAAERALAEIFGRAVQSGRIDELGNGRFARSLFERACAYRDVRVVRLGEGATAEDLTTLTAADVHAAFEEVALLSRAGTRHPQPQPPAARPPPTAAPPLFAPLEASAAAELAGPDSGASAEPAGQPRVSLTRRAHLRYDGTDTALIVPAGSLGEMTAAFEHAYQRQFSFLMRDRPIVVEAVSVEAVAAAPESGPWVRDSAPVPLLAHDHDRLATAGAAPVPAERVRMFSGGEWERVPLFRRADLPPAATVDGPAIIAEELATTVVEHGWRATVTDRLDLLLTRVLTRRGAVREAGQVIEADPVMLEIFGNLFMSIAEQMGVRLQSTARSVNIKERLDFSCAIFDAAGGLIANAPHIPVHLGSMGESIKVVMERNRDRMKPGDVYVLNDPYHGGTHLPDITVVTPVFARDVTPGTWSALPAEIRSVPPAEVLFYVASRGHHAEIGGISPGSMPADSTRVEEEGVLIDNWLLVSGGRLREAQTLALLREARYPSRSPETNLADLRAQVAANERGIQELRRMVDEFGLDVVRAYMGHVQDNAAAAVESVIEALSDGSFDYEMDNGARIVVAVRVDRAARTATIDFTGTSPQLPGNFNAPSSVAMAAVLYVFRTLVGSDIPLNAGCLRPLRVIIPNESMLSPSYPAAVAAGNVETSQAVAGALYAALGVQAEGAGTMNNVTFGNERYQYYETVASGSGAGKGPGGTGFDGTDVIQTKMTNSRLTDPEVLEWRYPVRVESYEIRADSGGAGQWRGGDGGRRRLRFLEPMTVTTLSGHRRVPAFGLAGGSPGALGRHWVERADATITPMRGCDSVRLEAADVFVMETPGGGGYGESPAQET